jgi:hypothetical protein
MTEHPDSLLLVELNEVNFDYVRRYIAQGELPTFAKLLSNHGLAETTSESEYTHLEPWIQWVTAHTGKSFTEHGVFRLGDIIEHDIDQIWERVERAGLKVGAISPMNAKNRTRNAAFFVPDPWTKTSVSGDRSLHLLNEALAQAVGDNASNKVSAVSYLKLLAGLLAHFRISSIGTLARLILSRRSAPWSNALFLDRFLADVFICQWRRHRPGFATLFLNAAAHIQHHYMFSSGVYDGPNRNPEWYLAPGKDPLLDVYRLYDGIVRDMLRLPGAPRVMLATGLHQDPYPTELYYYRLREHSRFLTRLGVSFQSVNPLMSRDFLIVCGSPEQAETCAQTLRAVQAPDGIPLFTVENRGRDLFVMLTYPKEIARGFIPILNARPLWDIHEDVAFVALKNGEHNGVGYFIDTGLSRQAREEFRLADLPGRIFAALGVAERGAGSQV